MKYPLFFCMFLIVTSFVAAQVPQAINYQAIARTSTGAPIVNAAIGVRFKILQTSATGNSVYSETHAPTTNQVGLFNLQIGNGGNKVGVFANIDWGSGAYFLEVATDPAGGTNYQVVGTPSQFLSVPYALRSSCNCSMMVDGDGDTWVETDPNGTDRDEIHMSLGLSPGSSLPGTGVAGPTVLILRRNIPSSISLTPNTMLEIFDPSGSNSTFVGDQAGRINTFNPTAIPRTGENNTAFGWHTLRDNDLGSNNTAIGTAALARMTNATNNTAIGYDALGGNSNGGENTAVGVGALFSNLRKSGSTAVGYRAMYRADNNSGINPGTPTFNTAVGFQALIGSNNTLNNTGIKNTAIGSESLAGNSKGDNNTATGADALKLNDTGSNNTAIGTFALRDNITGYENTAVGAAALIHNTTGKNNTASGKDALVTNISGNDNTANGYAALKSNDSGTTNTANGVGALFTNAQGNYNTASGGFALYSNTTGHLNTAIGADALRNNVAGSDNTAIGHAADVAGPNASNLTNASAIGANAKVTTPNSMILGDNNVNVGIGLSGNAVGPANKLEINAVAPDESGLTFRRLTSSSNTTVTATKVLSVDANGKVILALANSGGGGWLLGGNTLSTGSEFLGTLNTFALNFKVDNQKAGTVTPNGPVFLGYQAGNVNTALTNTGVGYQALLSNIAGNSNTATGYQALLNNTGSGNTAIGTKAMATNTGGGNNTALGLEALKDNQTGQGNTASGVWAMHENTIGEFNTAVGTFALEKNTRGFQNTATGHGALNKNVLGIRNTAIGASALASNTANDNIAIGAAALELNVTGIENTATGTFALSKNVSGRSNTAMGLFALQNNTRNDNAAFGVSVLRNNTAGGTNTAVGNEAMLANITGSENAAIGYRALASNTSGNTNTASGYAALFSNVTGNCNTGLGYGADVGSGNLTNATAIGCGAIVSSSNKIQLGSTMVTSIMGAVGFTTPSDGRFKSAVRQDAPGLDFVLSLRPVTYNFDYSKFSNFIGEKGVDQQVLKQKDQKREMGFIAQELESICLKSGIDIVNLIHTPENEKDNYAIAYGQLVVPLVKAVQEQQTQIETLKAQNAQLETIKQQNQSLQSQLDQLRADLQFFRASLEKQAGQTNNRNR